MSKSKADHFKKQTLLEQKEEQKKASLTEKPSDTFLQRVTMILSLAIPSALSLFVSAVTEMINLSFIGQLGNEALIDGVGLGNMTQNMLALSIILGFNAVLDTLLSQAVGAGNIEQCGVYMHRGRFIVTCLFVPLTFVLMNAEKLLISLKQDPQVAAYAQQYILTFLPGLYISSMNDCQRKLLNNFGKNQFVFNTSLISMLLHGVWCYIFVLKMDLELVGTGLANVSSQIVSFIAL